MKEELLQETHDAVIRIEARFEQYDKTKLDHEARIRVIEKVMWRALGAIAFVAFVVGLFEAVTHK